MRIGLVRRGYSPAGGAETYLRGFAQAALAAGHEVALFCSPKWRDWTFGPQIFNQGSSPISFSRGLEKTQPNTHCDCLFSLERVSRCDIYRAGDGVHAAWLQRRAPFESALKNWSFALNPKHRALIRLEAAAMRSAQKIIANSRMVRDEIAHFHGADIAAKVHIVRNGTDTAKWSPVSVEKRAELRQKFDLFDFQKAIAFVGSGWERKGLRFAIEATRKVPDAILLVAGKDDQRGYEAPHVRFLAHGTNIPDLLHASDAFILPTIYDPFSNATLEAYAVGLPIITTIANGCAEILDPRTDGTAVANPADIDALSTALDHWLIQPRPIHYSPFTNHASFAETLHIITS